jgi:acyl-CoA synthetase (AMP-forming)/AMP-acid ligase II
MVALYYGASRAGVVPVPLNTRLAPPEREFILKDADARLLVAESGFAAFNREVALCTPLATPRVTSPDLPLWQMYTSGTTGRPKGAVVSQRAAIANIVQIRTALAELCTGSMLVLMPMFHAGAAMGVLAGGMAGMCARIVQAFEPGAVLRILREEDITVATFVPAMIQMLVQHPDAVAGRYPKLKLIWYGAAPIAPDILRRAMDIFGCQFSQAYGLTEFASSATQLTPEDHVRALQGNEKLLLSAGRPLLGTQLRIVRPDGSDAGVGEVGEVALRGDSLMTGYWQRPEATAEALCDGWLYTGDAGYLDRDGYLFICDRIKDMIVSGGENIYPREIEEVLLKLPGIADAAVIGVPDAKWGETPLAIVVRTPHATLDEAAVVAHCRTQLAGYKCPKAVVFTEALPRNATGKVLKKDLRAPYWKGRRRNVN